MVRDLSQPACSISVTSDYPPRVKIPFQWDLEAPLSPPQPLTLTLFGTGRAAWRVRNSGWRPFLPRKFWDHTSPYALHIQGMLSGPQNGAIWLMSHLPVEEKKVYIQSFSGLLFNATGFFQSGYRYKMYLFIGSCRKLLCFLCCRHFSVRGR